MSELVFQDLEFGEEDGQIKVVFLKLYHFYLSKDDLGLIGDFQVSPHKIVFDCPEKRASAKFNSLLSKGFESLKCKLNRLKTVYIHQNSGIPLIGEGVFGLIDRNTNCIEVKPLTCCNLDCVFCSVDSGRSSKKATEYIVEKDYIVQEFAKLAEKKENDVEAHIGPQGEPLLYAPIVDLIAGLKDNPKVKVISMDTNGTLLTKKLIDDMAAAGLTRLNISLQSLDEKKCAELAGAPYNLKHVIEMIDYASQKISVLLAPVIVPSLNDDQLEKIVDKGRSIKSQCQSQYPVLGVQNFLNYKRGRNPVKQRSWEEFFAMLAKMEDEKKVKLKLSKEDFGIKPDTKLEKPFKKRDMIKALVVCDGPEKGEKIAAAKDRAIIVDGAAGAAIHSAIKVQIIRDKHNIFRAVRV
jgi:uncharacterized protein